MDTEADLIEERLGPVEPKVPVIWRPGVSEPEADLFSVTPAARTSCWLDPAEMLPKWLVTFPTGRQIIEKTIALRPATGTNADVRLLRRRACEFEIFKSVEQATWMPRIAKGFGSIDGLQFEEMTEAGVRLVVPAGLMIHIAKQSVRILSLSKNSSATCGRVAHSGHLRTSDALYAAAGSLVQRV